MSKFDRHFVAAVLLGLAVMAGVVASRSHAAAPTVQTSGPVSVVDGACNSARETMLVFPSVDGGAYACPTTQMGVIVTSDGGSGLSGGRRSVTYCNSRKNVSSAVITVRVDGVAPTTSVFSPGQALGVGDCATFAIPSTVVPKCISDTADAGLTVTECR
jgi:hypothetical protein